MAEPLERSSIETGRLSPAEVHSIGKQLMSALFAIHPNSPRIQELSALEELDSEQYEELQSGSD